MSTNINPDGLPGEDLLREMANSFFKALPGDAQNKTFLPEHGPDDLHTVLPEQVGSYAPGRQQTGFSDPLPATNKLVPPSASGMGISPLSFTNINNIPLAEAQSHIPVDHFAANEQLPFSIGGVGATPFSFTNTNANPVNKLQGGDSFDNFYSSQPQLPVTGSGMGQPAIEKGNPLSWKDGETHMPDHQFTDSKIPQSVAGSGISPSAVQQEKTFDIKDPQTSLPDPHFREGKIPQSVAGSGVSPSALRPENTFDIKDPQTSLPDPHFSEGKVPQSVAGSGVSPSAIRQENTFDIKQPQTSLPDPHFTDGKVPQSVAGSGRQPSLQKKEASPALPHTSDNSFEAELHKALTSFNTYIPASQLPITDPGGSSFYFLERGRIPQAEQPHSSVGNNAGKKNTSALKGIPAPPFDLGVFKKDFPILQEQVNGRPLIWLDNAATTQKPKQVIDRISYFYEHENSNIHRAAHELAARATDAYEGAREKVRRFLNAASVNEIIFVRGTTEAINLVAKSWGEEYLKSGDEIIISHLEHHANIVPWQQLAAKKGLKIRVIPVDDDGQLLMDKYAESIKPKN